MKHYRAKISGIPASHMHARPIIRVNGKQLEPGTRLEDVAIQYARRVKIEIIWPAPARSKKKKARDAD